MVSFGDHGFIWVIGCNFREGE